MSVYLGLKNFNSGRYLNSALAYREKARDFYEEKEARLGRLHKLRREKNVFFVCSETKLLWVIHRLTTDSIFRKSTAISLVIRMSILLTSQTMV